MKHPVGIIGLGMIGESMLASFLAHPRFEVRSCWDLSPEVRRGVLSRQPGTPLAADAESVLAGPGIELVYVATPPATHVDYGLQALAAGRALLMEKPLSTRLEDSRRLVAAAEQAGTPTAMNFAYGAGPVVETLAAALAAGEIGTLRSIEVRYQYPSWPLPNQLSAAAWITRRSAGGLVREMFSHHVYLTHRLLGKLEVVSAALSYPPGPDAAEDFVLAELRTGGIPLWLMGGVSSPDTPRTSDWTINGSKGALRIGESAQVLRASGGAWREVPLVSNRSAVEARLDALADLLEGKPHGLPGVRDGLEVQEVVEALLAAGSGGPHG